MKTPKLKNTKVLPGQLRPDWPVVRLEPPPGGEGLCAELIAFREECRRYRGENIKTLRQIIVRLLTGAPTIMASSKLVDAITELSPGGAKEVACLLLARKTPCVADGYRPDLSKVGPLMREILKEKTWETSKTS